MRNQLLAASLALATIMAIPARAEVTPSDVLDNLNAATAAMGGTAEAEVRSDGNTLSVEDWTAQFALPLDAGSFTVAFGTLEMAGNDDGTVTLTVPETQTIALGWDIIEVGTGSLTLAFEAQEYVTTASGSPGDIRYDYDIGTYRLTFGNLTVDGAMFEELPFDLAGEMTFTGLRGTYRITEGDLFGLSSNGVIDAAELNVEYTVGIAGDGQVRSISTSRTNGVRGTVEAALPAGGVSPLALAGALRDGLFVAYRVSVETEQSRQEDFLENDLLLEQVTEAGAMELFLRLDADGLAGGGSVTDYHVAVTQPTFVPVPIEATMATIEGGFALPLLKADTLQDAALRLVVEELTLGPDLWQLVDAGAALPRDPATLALDLKGVVRLLYDLPDLKALQKMEEAGGVPAEIHALSLNDLRLKLAGATVSATGDFTFDNSDPLDPMPVPDGSATIRLVGIERLLATLKLIGVLRDSDLTAASMMIGGFTRPGEGAEERVTEIEIDGDSGQITANGQRLR